MKSSKLIHFGTCSWKYESWRGIIYPKTGKFNYLEEYSKHYDTVEIDQWFWSLFDTNVKLPKKKDVVDYANSVPDNFKFTIKALNSITLTHHYNKNKKEPLKVNPNFLSVELYNNFLNALNELSNKISLILLQFEYLNKQKMPSQIEFLKSLGDFLKKIPRSIPVGIELRNPNYLNDIYFNFINDHGVYNVFLQGYYMPPIWEVYKKFSDRIKEKVVIRLHGPNRADIEEASEGNWNKIIFPKDDELIKIIEIIKDLEKKKVDTYVNVNNHYEGSAPLTIQRLQSYL